MTRKNNCYYSIFNRTVVIWNVLLPEEPILESTWSQSVQQVKAVCSEIAAWHDTDEAASFLQWSEEFSCPEAGNESSGSSQTNTYSHENNGRTVDIAVGTIHSVKGQTHAATLVLETKFHEFNLEYVLPHLLGAVTQKQKDRLKDRPSRRLRTHYVAMTRPSHLLCLAFRRETFDESLEKDEQIAGLIRQGWRVHTLAADGTLNTIEVDEHAEERE